MAKKRRKKKSKEEKMLRNILIVMGILLLSFLLVFLIINSIRHFKYKGMDFDIIKEGKVTFYHTSFPVRYEGVNMNYHVYIRNDPRKLEKSVPFDGKVYLFEMMVVNNTNNFVCGGDGGIAMYNLQQVFKIFGADIVKDPNATCDSLGRYGFLKIQGANKTSIEQVGPACYNLNINNCEILKVTERFLIEAVAKYHTKING